MHPVVLVSLCTPFPLLTRDFNLKTMVVEVLFPGNTKCFSSYLAAQSATTLDNNNATLASAEVLFPSNIIFASYLAAQSATTPDNNNATCVCIGRARPLME
jgi:hypothetical protein